MSMHHLIKFLGSCNEKHHDRGVVMGSDLGVLCRNCLLWQKRGRGSPAGRYVELHMTFYVFHEISMQ